MIQEKGIKLGREFKVYKVWKGLTNGRQWCFFLYSQSEKQADGSYKSGIKYTLWVENPEIIDSINTPTSLYLTKIKLVKPTTDQFGNFAIEVRAEFSLSPNQDNNNNQNVNNSNNTNNKQQPSKQEQTSDFGLNDSTEETDFDFGF